MQQRVKEEQFWFMVKNMTFKRLFLSFHSDELYEKPSKLCDKSYLQKRSSSLQEILICDQ